MNQRPSVRMGSVAITILVVALAIYLAMCAYLYFGQSGLIYFPSKEHDSNPGALGLRFEELTIQTKDNVAISAWYIPADEPRATILFSHGNGGNISHRLESIDIFNRLRMTVLIYDYRGYGKSEGVTTEVGTYNDARAVWDYLVNTRQISPDEIILFGRSLGAAVASKLATENTPRALILESPISSIPDMGAQIYPFLPVRLLARFEYNTAEYVENVTCPTLVIHSRDDEIAPFSGGRKVFESSANAAGFMEISGGHNDGFLVSGEKYRAGLDDFISNVLDSEN